MRRTILVLIGVVSLTSNGLCDNWTKTTETYFGRAQELSIWTNSGDTAVFLADSLSMLYTASLDDSSWTSWGDTTARNPRAVWAISGTDTLLIARWDFGVTTPGAWRVNDPRNKDLAFAWIRDDEGGRLRNFKIQSFLGHPNYAGAGYAMTQYYNSVSGAECGFQYTPDYGKIWNQADGDCDTKDDGTSDYVEGEGVVALDIDTVWWATRWCPDTSSTKDTSDIGVYQISVNSLVDNFNGSIDMLWNVNASGLTGYATTSAQILFAGIYSGDSAGVWKSTDGGSNWDSCSGTSANIRTLESYWASDTFYVWAGTDGDGILRSTDSGSTWSSVNTGIKCKTIEKIVCAHPISSGVLYALGTWSVYKSDDFGATWEEMVSGLPTVPVTALAANRPSRYLLGEFDLLCTDSGGTGDLLSQYAFEGIPGFSDTGSTVAMHVTAFPGEEDDLLVSTYEPDSATASEGKGKVYRSMDGGDSFVKVYEQPDNDDKGLVSSVVIDPNNDSAVFITFCDTAGVRIVKSSSYADTGSWSACDSWLPASAKPNKIAINPRNSAVSFLATDGQGVYRANSLAYRWVSRGLSGHKVRDIKVDYNDTNVVWAATDSGVYVSENAGTSWTLKDSLMTYSDAYSIALKPSAVSEVYVVCADDSTGYIYKSDDGGTTWSSVGSGLPSGWLVMRGSSPSANLETDSHEHPTKLYVGSVQGMYEMDLDYSGTISTARTWEAGPVYMDGDVTIAEGVSLEVNSGVDVQIDEGDFASSGQDTTLAELIVYGSLEVRGSSESAVEFDPDDDWYGIIVDSTGSAILQYAEIYDAYIGLFDKGSDNDTVANCLISGSDLCGVWTENGDLYVVDSRIDEIETGYGIYVDSCNPTLENDSIATCEQGIYLYKSASTIRDCVIRGPAESGIFVYSLADTGLTNANNIVGVEISNTHTNHLYGWMANVNIDSCSFVSPNFGADRSDYGISVTFTSDLKMRNTLVKDYDAAGVKTGFSATVRWDMGNDVLIDWGNNSVYTGDTTAYAIDATYSGPTFSAERNWWGSSTPDSSLFSTHPSYDVDFLPCLASNPLGKAIVAGDASPVPGSFELGQNYPNPFNPTTTIEFELVSAATVRLEIFNVLGQRVAKLVDAEYTAGAHSVTWDGRDLSGGRAASGVYFYRLESDSQIRTQKMLLLK